MATAFQESMLVNRIFAAKLNGKKHTIQEMRDSIDAESKVDKYSDVPTNAVETDLKSRASRCYNNS